MLQCFFSCHLNKGGFLLNQQVARLMHSDVEEEIIKAAKNNKLNRVEGYNELRGFASALYNSTGMALTDFNIPQGLILRAVGQDEVRVKGRDGKQYFLNTKDNTFKPLIPPQLSMKDVPILHSISDQGPLNMSALSFLSYSRNSLMVHTSWDPYHRGWNDVKGAAKKVSFPAYRCILELVVFFNVNFGPYQSQQWWWRKRAMLEAFLTRETWRGSTWNSFVHMIATEKRIEEPHLQDEQEALFNQLRAVPNFVGKGGAVKLMRWFSFFEACAEWEGYMVMTKMVMEYGLQQEGQLSEDEAQEELQLPKQSGDVRKELQELKRRKGTFKLAPSLVNNRSLCIKDILMSVCRHTWKIHSARTREVKSPDDYLKFSIASVGGGSGWKQELAGIVDNSLCRTATLQHVLPQWSTHTSSLEWHAEFFHHLLELRAMSLASFFCLPPTRYAHALSSDVVEARSAQQIALQDFHCLLKAEAAALHVDVGPLKLMYWAKNPVARAIFLAHEDDEESHTNNAKHLHTILCRGMKDTKMIENTHSFGRDLLRSSKHSTFGNVRIMSNTLKSGTLNERNISLVQASNADKVGANTAFMKEPITRQLTSKGFKLPKETQQMMMPKLKKLQTDWVSPSAASLFQSVAATEWVFSFFSPHASYPGKGINSAWVSGLAKPGSFIVQESKQILLKVVAVAQYGFLGWLASPVVQPDGTRLFTLEPNKDLLTWYHVLDLADWKVIPTEARLVSPTRGPVGWVQVGEPIQLHFAACLEGCKLTMKQITDIIQQLGGEAISGGGKKALQTQLIEMTLPKDLQQIALEKLSKPDAEDGDQGDTDSELSEIISDLGREDGNQQDVQELKKRNARAKAKRKAQTKDASLEATMAASKKKAKSKAKSKAKCKAKCKPKAASKKRKQMFVDHLINRMKASKLEGEALDIAMKESVASAPGQPTGGGTVEASTVGTGGGASSSSAAVPELDQVTGGETVEASTVVTGGEASASSAAMPEQHSVPQELALVHAREDKPATRAASVRMHKSPEFLCSLLAPPGAVIGINFSDHRFTSSSKLDASKLCAPYTQKSYSMTWGDKRSWEQAIQGVHNYQWKKWAQLKEQAPLATGQEEQKPGVIEQSILEEIAKVIATMPGKKRQLSVAPPGPDTTSGKAKTS